MTGLNKSNVFNKSILSIAFFLLIGTSLFAVDPVMLREDKGEYPLGSFLELLEDKEGRLTLEDVQKPEMEKYWFKSKMEIPSLGFTASVYWVRFQMSNQFEKNEYLLELSYPLLDKFDIYISQSGSQEYSLKKGGDYYPFNNREISYHNFLFRIPIESKEIKRIYFRIETQSSMQIPLKLYNRITFLEKLNLQMIGLGIYYGIMIVMFFYNLFLFFSVKDKSYLFYVLYIASFAILQGTVNGLSFEYLGFLFPLINETAALLMILCCIFIVLFVQSFLHTKEHTPLFHKILKGIFIYLCIIPIIFLNLNYSQGAKIASITVVAVLSLIIIIGWLVLKRGYKPARYFLFAWTFYLIGSILLALRQVGILPSIFITEYGAQIGSTFEVILLSFGLADRINILRKEKVLAQAEALEAQRILNQELEDKVQRRTIQLEEAHQKIIILEKENTEKQLAGGFAHEMRNALVGPKLVIQHILGEDGEEPYESIGLANSRKLKEIYLMIKDFVPEDTLQDTLKAMKTIFENEERMDINLKLIYRAVSKGLSITQLIMDYAKIGNELTGKDSLDLNVIIKNLTDEYKKEWAVHPIRINLDLTKENSNIQGLETHFESIFKNLILNAKDAVLDKNLTDKRDLFIEIKTLVVSNNFQIEITDNGSGISPKNLSRIYDAFFSTKPDTGTGLGLGIVKKIVSIYNGKIDVKSELGKGTSFMISIPLQIGSK